LAALKQLSLSLIDVVAELLGFRALAPTHPLVPAIRRRLAQQAIGLALVEIPAAIPIRAVI
jgi:hypothetical protein